MVFLFFCNSCIPSFWSVMYVLKLRVVWAGKGRERGKGGYLERMMFARLRKASRPSAGERPLITRAPSRATRFPAAETIASIGVLRRRGGGSPLDGGSFREHFRLPFFRSSFSKRSRNRSRR